MPPSKKNGSRSKKESTSGRPITARTKSPITPLRLRPSLELEEWWRITWPWRNSNNYKKWKNITKCLPNRREIERLNGSKTKKKWTKRKFIELTWAISWLRMRQPPLRNWLLIDSFLITSRVSLKLNKKTSWSREKIKWSRIKPWRKTTRLKSTSGLFKT